MGNPIESFSWVWRRRRSLSRLTPREHDVLASLAAGRSNKEIAAELCLSAATVKGYIESILKKTDSPNRVSAAMFFAERHQPPGLPPPCVLDDDDVAMAPGQMAE